MKTTFRITLALLLLSTLPVLAHHMAEGILDEDLYAMIEAAVADTPHAELDFNTIGGRTEILIEAGNLRAFENLVDAQLMTFVGMLDGQVSMAIEFDESQLIYMTIIQIEELTDKDVHESFFISDDSTLEGVKVLYR